jgi:outer membrane protein OmpA-like peptidoglycan-associated protein
MNETDDATAPEYKNQNIQLGLKLRLFGGQKTFQATTPTLPPPPVDSDGDGIPDDQDKCPTQAGVAKYDGCPIPDSDGDGINDELDKCPNQAGVAKYDGCPIPDSDGDGINDEEDKCPNQAGIAKYDGCPIPDRDNDGVNDEEDKCPDLAGTVANNGCPEVPEDVNKLMSSSSQKLSFSAGSTKLSTTANTSLNKVIEVLQQHPEMNIRIEGHSDNMEKDGDDLSDDRAKAVEAYLVSKGIDEDRIKTEGFGSTMPIADNNTSAGRAKNRRVELKIFYGDK